MRNRNTLFASLFIAMFLCTMPHAFAKVWYVKTNGNNANSGATEALAKSSIQAMLNSTSVVSGDTILVWGGNYQEQVVTGNLNVTIIGSQGGSRTVIQAPAWASMVSYTFVDAMNWNGVDKLSSNKLKPIVFANASSSSILTNIRGIDIDGSTANMPEGATEVFAGLVYRQSQGRIGGYGDSVYNEVRNITPTTNTNELNNTVGILFIERAKPTMIGTRVKNYRNIGIGSIGMNTSALQTVQDHQPSPIIINCIVQGVDGGTSSTDPNTIQAGLVVVNGARVNITKSHIYGNRSGNATGDRIAYGIYMWNARNSTIGDGTAKANGNVISDNEIGLYVRLTVSSFSPTLYTIRNNNIVYNGGTAANLGTPAGEVANYASATASFVTDGAVRFSHSSNFSQTLDVANNAWGNTEAQSVFSASGAGYSLASYKSNPVAFWRETSNDNITFSNPLSPATTIELNVNPTFAGSNTSGEPIVDVNYGFTKFDQLNRAVYAAGNNTGGSAINDPKINLLGDVVENGTVIITKPVDIIGSGASCDLYPSVTLRDGLNEPTVWIYGMSAVDGDYTDRTPVRDTLNKIRIMANDVQTAGTSSSGPAVLITGGTDGLKSPIKPVMSYMSISAEFDGQTGPQAYSTSQSGTSTLSKRYALAAAGPYYALYTRRPENCDNIVGGSNVIDQADNNTLPKFQFDNIIEVATCTELNTAIQNATGPDFTTMLIVADIGTLQSPCEVIVNNTQPITVDVQTGSTAFIHYLLNPGAGPNYGGGSNAICSFLRTTPTSGGIHNAVRVTAYPPACLQTAVNLISSGSDNLLVAAAGSAFTDAGSVTINKAFDFMGATNATAHLASPTAGNATYEGKFVLNTNTDINNVGGSLTSTRGTTFGDASNQVDLNFTNTSLSNFGAGTGDAINMALQLINSTSGSRRMELTTSSHSTETPTISKRVYLNGLANRGTTVGLITLNGSGNCTDPSVLRNLSAATITVNSNADCIQTALGIANCTTYTQNIEGVGTNATNGSGGTVNLNNVAYTQNVDISKSVTFTNSTTTTGTVTLRRGADLLGGLSNFAATVNLEQCASFTGAVNPNPQLAVTIANAPAIINIAGYGSTNPVGTGSQANGVWQFNNINISKPIKVRGTNYNVASNLLTSDCSLLASTTFPGINASRDLSVETVIGANGSNGYSASNNIFVVSSDGVDIDGFMFRNILANEFAAVFINAGRVNVQLNNNILTSDKPFSHVLVKNNGSGTALRDIDITNNYVMISSPGSAPNQNGITLTNLEDASSVQNSIEGNAVSVAGAGVGVSMRIGTIAATNSTSGVLIKNNFLNGGTSHGLLFEGNLNGITVEQNMITGTNTGLEINPGSTGILGGNGITVRENRILNNGTSVRIAGNLTSMTTNRIFVNNNNLSSTLNNNVGINVSATTTNTGNSTNFLDLRFNYWGSDLGPVRGTNVATNPVFALSDSLRLKGHVPFEHTTGSKISDASTNGRWVIYPVAVSDIDGNATCGWQYSTMMGPVLRVNGAGTSLLGMYPTITDARDNTNATFPATPGARNTSDQIVVVAGTGSTSYGTFGYASASSNEPAYPVVFDESPEPSVIRGLNRPRIMLGAGATGSIKVESTYPAGVSVKDFIEHVATSGANVTMIEFLNPSSNTVDYNFFASSHAHTSFKGIRFSNSTNDDANNTQKFTNNRINLGRNPGWPGGPAITSAPSSFIGIEIADRGAFGGNVVEINDNEISTAAAVGTRSIGIDVNGTNISNFGNILRNTIRHMAAGGTDIIHPSKWGTGIYVTRGSNFTISGNNIAGGNSIANGTDVKGHDGITLDSPSGFTIGSGSSRNNIGTEYNSLTQEKPVVASSPQRGYGIKVYSTTGTGNIVNVTIDNLVSGSNTTGCATAAVYVGGTTGTLSGVLQNSYIYSTNAAITGSTTSSAAVQIGTSAYNSQMSSGNFNITNNIFGDYAGTAYNNTLDLAIGTSPDGNTRANCANNIFTNIRNNSFLDVAFTGQFSVADGRPFAGSNIRNIFGYTNNWSSLNGPTTAGQGNSGNNVFTHGAILTGERNLANYNVAMSRTANAQQTNPSSSTEPVKIWRLLQTPLIAAKSTDSVNTLELRENYNQTSGSNSQRIFNENLIFPDQRVLLLGPANGNAYIVPSGSTAVGITSTGRENKDIRGGINFWISGTQKYAEIPGSATTGAANKGDVYLQGATIGNDISYVKYYYAGTEVTGSGFSSTITADIKAGIDDADDNGAIPAGAMTQHRTGVFVRGNGTSFTKDNTNEAITGMNMLNVYPNPASGDVTVSFKVPVAGFVRVALYNALGQKVTDLREENLNADTYSTVFNAASLTNGTYHVRLVHDQFTLTTPVTIIK